MNKTRQEVVWYKNYEKIENIQKHMRELIEDGWRVHTCLNKSSDILIVYEKELESWN